MDKNTARLREIEQKIKALEGILSEISFNQTKLDRNFREHITSFDAHRPPIQLPKWMRG